MAGGKRVSEAEEIAKEMAKAVEANLPVINKTRR